jgi:hypothetical protein
VKKITLRKILYTKKITLRPVMVTWCDAHAVYPGWGSLDSIDAEPAIIHTVGWLIPEAKRDHTVIVLSAGDSSKDYMAEHVDSGIAIPNDMILKIRKLKT